MTQFLCPWSCCLRRSSFKSISSTGINKVEMKLNTSWSRYNDTKAVWHLFSYIEMKYNVLILNAYDRINCNDLRFFSSWRSLGTTEHSSTQTHTPYTCVVIDSAGLVKAEEYTAVTHWFRRLTSLQYSRLFAPGQNDVSVSNVCWSWTKNVCNKHSGCCCCFSRQLTLSWLRTNTRWKWKL